MQIYAIPNEDTIQELFKGDDDSSVAYREAYKNPLRMIEYAAGSDPAGGFQAQMKRAVFWNPATRLFYSVVINSDGCYVGRIGVDYFGNLTITWGKNYKYVSLASAQIYCAFDKNEE